MAEKAKRRWYQYSLKALLILMLIVSLPLGARVAWRQYLIAKRLAEIESAFQWLESLEYPDMPNGQAVLVTTRSWSKDRPTPYVERPGLAFLLAEDATSFTVLTASLCRRTIQREANLDERYFDDSSFERSSLRIAVETSLDRRSVLYHDPAEHFLDGLSERGQLLILAWTCARHGHGDWAIKLYEAAEASIDWRKAAASNDPQNGVLTFLDRVAADFAHFETRSAIRDCGTERPRPELLKKLRWIKEQFPNSKYAADVQEKVAILEQMVAEDAAHDERRSAGPPFERLSKHEQIEELIYQLRDCSLPSTHSCAVLEDPSAPFERLQTYGYDAIPHLAAALSDKSLSRSIDDFGADSSPGYRVRTIREITDRLLCGVAGRSFDPNGPAWGDSAQIAALHDDRRYAAIQKAALEWHRQLVTKGEEAYLVEVIRELAPHWGTLARHLGRKNPDAACGALLEAAAKADDKTQLSISNIFRWMHTDKSVPFLVRQLAHDRAGNRLEAAEALTELGRPEGVAAMIEQWQSRDMAELQHVGPFLVRSRQPQAIRAVANRFSEQAMAERSMTMYEARKDENPKHEMSDEIRGATIELLLVALGDTEMHGEHRGYWGGPSIEGLRICDMAGYHLGQLDPARFPFDIEAPLGQRERVRIRILANHPAASPNRN